MFLVGSGFQIDKCVCLRFKTVKLIYFLNIISFAPFEKPEFFVKTVNLRSDKTFKYLQTDHRSITFKNIYKSIYFRDAYLLFRH